MCDKIYNKEKRIEDSRRYKNARENAIKKSNDSFSYRCPVCNELYLYWSPEADKKAKDLILKALF